MRRTPRRRDPAVGRRSVPPPLQIRVGAGGAVLVAMSTLAWFLGPLLVVLTVLLDHELAADAAIAGLVVFLNRCGTCRVDLGSTELLVRNVFQSHRLEAARIDSIEVGLSFWNPKGPGYLVAKVGRDETIMFATGAFSRSRRSATITKFQEAGYDVRLALKHPDYRTSERPPGRR